MGKEKLKIALLIDSYDIPSWQYSIIKEIRYSRYAEIKLIIKNDVSHSNRSTIQSKLFQWHLKFDQLLLGRKTDYYRIMDSRKILSDYNEMKVIPVENGSATNFTTDDVQAIKNYKCDIILNIGSGMVKGGIANAAKYGMWTYQFGSHTTMKDEAFGYWEVMKGYETTVSTLWQMDNSSEEGKVIYRSWMPTQVLSISKTRNAAYWRASTFMPRILEGLYTYGDAYLKRLANQFRDDTALDAERPYEVLSTLTMLKNIFSHFGKISRRVYQKIVAIDQWYILFKIKSNNTFSSSTENFKALTPPKDRFWADPFVISQDNRHYIFLEELLFKTKKGHISVIELDEQGNVLQSGNALERPYHLSYPFVFKYNGQYYMLPETGENKTIELYKCVSFPYQWEFVMNLMEGFHTADATLFYHANKWWLFCCIDSTGREVGMLDELHLFFSDDLFTQNWQPHPCNPINTNTKTARPAGNLFIYENEIYRPSQDCSGSYGKAINFNRIITLSETEYKEELVSKIIPGWEKNVERAHTFNFNNQMTVMDGLKCRRRISV
ncbi:MAG: hypothetical protein M3342_02400 [Bacteroidota bacterium]|nr:hypothetical protein [Bacteroidota bacterium]